MAINLNDLARVELVDKLAAKVAAKLNTLNDTTFKAAKVDGNSLKFYTSTDTTGQADETIDIPAEQFLDQASTSFVPNFQFSALLYDGATNPNLDGKAVLVLALKTKSNDGKSESTSYSFVDVSRLVDTYTASDTSVTVTNYKVKVNISTDARNALKLNQNGLYAAGVTDTATTTTAGLMSAADKTKVDNLDVELSKKLDSDANAVSATKLETARNVITNLASTAAASFNGTASISAGVTGTLPIGNGGTGLTASPSMLTNLASTTAANVLQTSPRPGVTGTLPVANGGTGQTNLANVTVGAATKATNADSATKATQDASGNVITSTYATKDEVTAGLAKKLDVAAYISLHNAKRYGYRISKTEADPDARVEYILDAVGMTPAHMDFTNGVFDYGSWGDVWFVKDNKPLMLKYDGTIDYYLDPNNYAYKLDGTASDVANVNYGGNAMAQIPLCWVYRYEDDNYYYEIVSPVKIDDNYKAYAHTDASGNIKPYFYNSIFAASGNSSKLRSISGQTIATLNAQQMFSATRANGSNWFVGSWAQYQLIRTLLVLLGKSCDTQTVFGNGNERNNSSTSVVLKTGTLNTKGQFNGYSSNTQNLKVFHIEDFWGNIYIRVAGAVLSEQKLYIKMTPEGTGYLTADTTGYTVMPNFYNVGNHYCTQITCNEFGAIAIAGNGGSSSTYFCDTAGSADAVFTFIQWGGAALEQLKTGGAFHWSTARGVNANGWVSNYISYV